MRISNVDSLAEATAERYLGGKLCVSGCQSTEFHNRLAAGWAKFHTFRNELTSKSYSVRSRLRLFEAVVSTTVLFGCCSWALTKAMVTELDITRRRMLRYVLRIYRRDDTWKDYLQRAARTIEDFDDRFRLVAWSQQYRMRKLSFAGFIGRCTDGRWSQRILFWEPCGFRSVGRPACRWSDTCN